MSSLLVTLDRYGVVPEEQTRADGDAVAACLTPEDEVRALANPWSFFSRILGWREHQVAGLPDGQPLPAGVSVQIDEADTVIEPHWTVIDPEGRPTACACNRHQAPRSSSLATISKFPAARARDPLT